jgi:hypothetical protein
VVVSGGDWSDGDGEGVRYVREIAKYYGYPTMSNTQIVSDS